MSRNVLLGILVATMGLATVGAMYASSDPDGLERVAEDLGFAESGEEAVLEAPIPDYELPGTSHAGVGTSLAGVAGAASVGALAMLVGIVLRRRRR